MKELLSSALPYSSSSSSLAASFLLLTTHSLPRARWSCGCKTVPGLQRGVAGSDLEVASLGAPGESFPAEAPMLWWQQLPMGTAPWAHSGC